MAYLDSGGAGGTDTDDSGDVDGFTEDETEEIIETADDPPDDEDTVDDDSDFWDSDGSGAGTDGSDQDDTGIYNELTSGGVEAGSTEQVSIPSEWFPGVDTDPRPGTNPDKGPVPEDHTHGIGGLTVGKDSEGVTVKGRVFNKTDSEKLVTRNLYVNGQLVADAANRLPPGYSGTFVFSETVDPDGERKDIAISGTNYQKTQVATLGSGERAEIPGDGLEKTDDGRIPDFDGAPEADPNVTEDQPLTVTDPGVTTDDPDTAPVAPPDETPTTPDETPTTPDEGPDQTPADKPLAALGFGPIPGGAVALGGLIVVLLGVV